MHSSQVARARQAGAQLTPASAHRSTGRAAALGAERGARRLLTVVSLARSVTCRRSTEDALRRARRARRARAARRRWRRGRAPRAVLRQPAGRAPGPAHAAAHPRRRAAGVRRRGLPRLQHRPDHEARALLAGLLLPVLREQGRRVPAARRAGGAPGERVDRGARPAHPRSRRAGPRCGRGSPATPRSTRATNRSSTRSRATTSSRPSRGAPARRPSRGSTRGWRRRRCRPASSTR